MARNTLYPPSVKPGIPKLGLKPDGWIETTFGDVLQVLQRTAEIEDDVEYQLVTAKRARGGIVPREILTGKKILTKDQYYVAADDFLISKRQIVHGACGIVPSTLDGALVSGEYSVLRVKDGLLLKYLDYFTHTDFFQMSCFQASVGVDVEKMIFDLKSWLTLKIYLPPVHEQQKIVDILSTWENAIILSEQIVLNKQKLKRELLEQLFSARLRFPRTSEEWASWLLGDITDYVKGCNYTSSDLSDEKTGVNFITLKCVAKGGGFQRENIKYYSGQVDSKFLLGEGDLLFANTDLTREGDVVGSPILIPKLDGKTIMSMDLTKVNVSDHVQKLFLYYLLQTDKARSFMRTRAHGSTVLHLDVKSTKKMPISLPSISEQRRIATFLEKCDEEIYLLYDRLEYFKQQKRGLIQKLLSGQIRIRV